MTHTNGTYTEVVVRIDERLAALQRNVQEHKTLTQQVASDHETRLRRLESRWWKLAGGAAGFGAVIGFFTERLF